MKHSRIVRLTFFCALQILGVFFVVDLLEPPFLFAQSPTGSDKTLLIAAASNMRFAMEEIADEFGKASQAEVKVSYGSSGSFTSQLISGAPFDLFFSADEALPQRLIFEGLVLKDTLYRYGTGRIVLWAPKGSPIHTEKGGMKALLHPSVHKIAVANPRHAPYGAAAVAALKNAGLYDLLRSRLVFGGNISEATHFVRAGVAEIGILSYSLAVGSPLKAYGLVWPVPATSYPPLNQGAVILRKSRNVSLAKSFINFIIGGKGREILGRYGYRAQGHTG